MNATVIISTWEQLPMRDVPLSAVSERARAIQRVQTDAMIIANAVNDEKVKAANLEGLPSSKVGDELGLPVVQAELAKNLHEVGLLSKLKLDGVLGYLRSDDAKADAASFSDYHVQLQKGILILQEEERKRKERKDEELELQGLPHSDYLHKGEKVRVPMVGQFVGMLSRLAKANGFEIPPPFEGDTLLQAVKGRIQREIRAPYGAMADAVRACLRLIGDAFVHVHATADSRPSLDTISTVMILPIVDSGFSTQRERLLQRLLAEAFRPRMNVIRGGVVLGYRGFGKSQLVRQLVFGKQLLQWSIGKRRLYDACRHVGMYVDNPNKLGKPLQMGCPPALLAAGLCNAGAMQSATAPAWTKSIQDGFDPANVAEWVDDNQVNAMLVIDEAQQALSDPSPKASTEVSIARSKVFWDSLDDCCQNPKFPMIVITGTGSEVAHLVYTRPRENYFEMQKDKFHMYWLDYEYSEVEICLMLTRQGTISAFPSSGVPWIPAYSSEDKPLNIESLTEDVDKILPEDVTLALALAVARASGCDPASHLMSNSAKPVDSHWIESGQVVHPSIEHVVQGIQADALGDVGAWHKTKARPGRLTLQAATEALKDERVLRASYASRSKILRRVWQTGMTARSLVGINTEERDTNTKLQEWHDAMNSDDDCFQQIMLALLDCMGEDNPNWQLDALTDPLKPPKPVTVKRLLLRHRAMHPDAAVEDVKQFEKKLSRWRLKQRVAYRASSERAGMQGEELPSTAGFLSSMFAFLALQWSLTRDLFVTRREFWAIHKQTGELGEDYELVVAESLHRNFVSKVLARKLMPSVPQYLWKEEDGALKEDLVTHDRTQVYESGKNSIHLTSTKWGKNPSREEMLGRVLKEVPDKFGGDLVMILEDTQERDPQKYHLIRVQVEAGGVDKVLTKKSLEKLLSREKVQAALELYAGALGVRPEQLVMHRLLVTPKKLRPNITSLFPKRSHGTDSNTGSDIVDSSTNEPLPLGDQGREESGTDGTNDTTNLYYLDHEDYNEFLFADARLLSSRIWANSASDLKERQLREEKVEDLEGDLSGLLNDTNRKVGLGEPSNMEKWTEQFPISSRGHHGDAEGDSDMEDAPEGTETDKE